MTHNFSQYKIDLQEWRKRQLAKGRSPSDIERSMPPKIDIPDYEQNPQVSSHRRLVSGGGVFPVLFARKVDKCVF